MNILRHFGCLFKFGWFQTETTKRDNFRVDTCLHCGYSWVHPIKPIKEIIKI